MIDFKPAYASLTADETMSEASAGKAATIVVVIGSMKKLSKPGPSSMYPYQTASYEGSYVPRQLRIEPQTPSLRIVKSAGSKTVAFTK